MKPMKPMKPMKSIKNHKQQQGVAAVEFALIAAILFMLLFGIMELSRILFAMNTAVEATRLGARLAVVCDKDAPVIKNEMIDMLGYMAPSNINVEYDPPACDINSCRYITVSITGLSVNTFIPLVPFTLNMPPFSTTLPRESMSSLNNPICV